MHEIQYFSQNYYFMMVEEGIYSRFNISVKKLFASRLKVNIHENKYFNSKVVYMMIEERRYTKFNKSI
jgi:lipopolysaccharide biosynthesis glycosyltransferase